MGYEYHTLIKITNLAKFAQEECMTSKQASEAPHTLAIELAQAVASLQIDRAMSILDKVRGRVDQLPFKKDGPIFLGYLAWGIDYEPSYFYLVRRVLPKFRQIPADLLRLSDLVHIDVAEGLLHLHHDHYDTAIKYFSDAMYLADRANNTDLMAVTRYYSARACWRKQEYGIALDYANDAEKYDRMLKCSKRIAVIHMMQGWLHFLKGNIKEAERLLTQADKELKGTDHYIDRGNVLSFRGRFIRRTQGVKGYELAIECFYGAIAEYQKRNPSHRNIGRSYVNIAVACRLKALNIEGEKVVPGSQVQVRAEVEEWRRKAFGALEEAQRIYTINPKRHQCALGKIHHTKALLYYDAGDFDVNNYRKAAEEAQKAYRYGQNSGDKELIAKIKILQCMVALKANKEDGQLAFKRANEAVKIASTTEYGRIQARAYIWKGQALLRAPFNDPLGANQCLSRAEVILVDQDQDHLREELEALREDIDSYTGPVRTVSGPITPDTIEGRSLEDIVRGVEKDVVRYVYESTGRNIIATAKKLGTNSRRVKRSIYTSCSQVSQPGSKPIGAVCQIIPDF
jgi:hypothetical protein